MNKLKDKIEIKTRFRRFFEKVDEGEYCNSLICYRKIPLEYREECFGDKCHSITSKWIHAIRIDLWIINLRIKIKEEI